MKILAIYLPQYHEVKENNKWWGKGYTEWTAVKKAKPLFKGHVQPKMPLNNNYYDLSDESAKTWKWQAELANKYGIYGFCIYHYWFKGRQILEKPMEILLKHKEININYSIIWANEDWTRTWYGNSKEILLKQEYGSEQDWEKHFLYLLKYFRDERYIKIDGKPVVNIYRSHHIKDLGKIRSCWNKLAKNNGFSGVYIVAANNHGPIEKRAEFVDAYYNFEPGYTLKHRLSKLKTFKYIISVASRRLYNRLVKGSKVVEHMIDAKWIYDRNYKSNGNIGNRVFVGSFTNWDNTPRVSYRGIIYKNTTPDNFYHNLKEIQRNINSDDFVYINSWNEWGEGCYLEPDSIHRFDYLEMIRKIITLHE